MSGLKAICSTYTLNEAFFVCSEQPPVLSVSSDKAVKKKKKEKSMVTYLGYRSVYKPSAACFFLEEGYFSKA